MRFVCTPSDQQETSVQVSTTAGALPQNKDAQEEEQTSFSRDPVTVAETEKFMTNTDDVYKNLKSLSRVVAPGLDISATFMRQISHPSRTIDEDRYYFLSLLTWMVNIYLTGRFPDQVNSFAAEVEDFPLGGPSNYVSKFLLQVGSDNCGGKLYSVYCTSNAT